MENKERVVSQNERDFLISAVDSELRVDGRKIDVRRKVVIAFHDKPGEVEVTTGSTRVIASVVAELAEPFPDRPSEGSISFSVDLSPLASPSFEVGRQSSTAVEIVRLLDRSIKDSNAVDTETLCVLAGQRVWSIRVDVRVCDHQGNLHDACVLAAVAALASFRRPDVTVIGNKVTVHSTDERHPVPLTIHYFPIANTYAFYQNTDKCVLDPSLSEELVADATLTVVSNANKEICGLHKTGGVPIPRSAFTACIKTAVACTSQISKYLKGCLDEVNLERDPKVD